MYYPTLLSYFIKLHVDVILPCVTSNTHKSQTNISNTWKSRLTANTGAVLGKVLCPQKTYLWPKLAPHSS